MRSELCVEFYSRKFNYKDWVIFKFNDLMMKGQIIGYEDEVYCIEVEIPINGNKHLLIPQNDILKTIKMESEAPYGVSYEVNKPMETPEHYKMAIEPIEFAMKNGLGICEFNILKYICRFKRKDGKDDLLKARHYLDMLIQYEYPEIQDLDSGKLPTF